jgi:hypothetical protein
MPLRNCIFCLENPYRLLAGTLNCSCEAIVTLSGCFSQKNADARRRNDVSKATKAILPVSWTVSHMHKHIPACTSQPQTQDFA